MMLTLNLNLNQLPDCGCDVQKGWEPVMSFTASSWFMKDDPLWGGMSLLVLKEHHLTDETMPAELKEGFTTEIRFVRDVLWECMSIDTEFYYIGESQHLHVQVVPLVFEMNSLPESQQHENFFFLLGDVTKHAYRMYFEVKRKKF